MDLKQEHGPVMSEIEEETEEEATKKSKMPMIIGLVLALIGGGGGFYAAFSGMILSPGSATEQHLNEMEVSQIPDVSFVEVQPLTITLGTTPQPRHLRFSSQLEVPSEYKSDVETVLPRVVDVFNTYLRALRVEDIEDPTALIRMRSQMLRRVNIVAGEGRVNDLLIMEFIIN